MRQPGGSWKVTYCPRGGRGPQPSSRQGGEREGEVGGNASPPTPDFDVCDELPGSSRVGRAASLASIPDPDSETVPAVET